MLMNTEGLYVCFLVKNDYTVFKNCNIQASKGKTVGTKNFTILLSYNNVSQSFIITFARRKINLI